MLHPEVRIVPWNLWGFLVISLESDQTEASWWGGWGDPGRAQEILLDSQWSISLVQEKDGKSLTGDRDHSLTIREQGHAQRERSITPLQSSFPASRTVPTLYSMSTFLRQSHSTCHWGHVLSLLHRLIQLPGTAEVNEHEWFLKTAGAKWELSSVQLSVLYKMIRILFQIDCIVCRWSFSMF